MTQVRPFTPRLKGQEPGSGPGKPFTKKGKEIVKEENRKNGDAGYADRGACVRMDPALDSLQWACVYKDNLLYKEITALLMSARLSGTTCRVQWNVTDPAGHKVIRYVEC